MLDFVLVDEFCKDPQSPGLLWRWASQGLPGYLHGASGGGKGVGAVGDVAQTLKRRLRKRKRANEAGADKLAKRKWRVRRVDKK